MYKYICSDTEYTHRVNFVSLFSVVQFESQFLKKANVQQKYVRPDQILLIFVVNYKNIVPTN